MPFRVSIANDAVPIVTASYNAFENREAIYGGILQVEAKAAGENVCRKADNFERAKIRRLRLAYLKSKS